MTIHIIGRGELGSWIDSEFGTIRITYAIERDSGRGVKGDRRICYVTADGLPVVRVDDYLAQIACDGDRDHRRAIGLKLYYLSIRHAQA